MNPDFEYLSELTGAFFRQRVICNSLSLIEMHEISGWEVWLQIQFAYFLSQHHSNPEWWREWPIELDRRTEKERLLCRPDFIIRKKGWRQESYTALEMKQHPNAGICLNNMIKDITKISKVRGSALNLRTFWVLGIHQRQQKAELRDLIESRLKAADMPSPGDHLLIKYIPASNYAYSMF